jgi:protein gp37
MAETSAIEWCDATVNFWWGCTKVSPGCDHCYAETLNAFRGTGEWGPNAPRRKIKGAVSLLRMLNRKSATSFFSERGRSIRVFMQSMSDTFDNEVSDDWRAELFAEAKEARWVKIILLTKRGANVPKMVPPDWLDAWPKHIGLMFSITNQREADRDIPRLIDLKKRLGLPWIGLSLEPLLGRVRLKAEWLDHRLGDRRRRERYRCQTDAPAMARRYQECMAYRNNAAH